MGQPVLANKSVKNWAMLFEQSYDCPLYPAGGN